MISFDGSIYKIAIDSEGETKITILVPRSELDSISRLQAMLEKAIKVSIE